MGLVVDVHAYTSEIDLITSPRFRIAAHFEGDPRPVTFEGCGGGNFTLPYGAVRNVPSDLIVSSDAPLRLVSSGLGGIFPAGLSIGVVSDLYPGRDGIFLEGRVGLPESLLSIQEVAILLPAADSKTL